MPGDLPKLYREQWKFCLQFNLLALTRLPMPAVAWDSMPLADHRGAGSRSAPHIPM
jgi:hypothetical protein